MWIHTGDPPTASATVSALACAVEEEHERVLLALDDLERREQQVGVVLLTDLDLPRQVMNLAGLRGEALGGEEEEERKGYV